MEHFDWNDGWQFGPQFSNAMVSEPYAGPPLETVRLPHTVKTLPYNYCSENDYQMVSGYRRVFDAPSEWMGRHVLLTFGAVAHDATVYCNGVAVAHHSCGYTAFTVDLSGHLLYGRRNVIAVRCDSRETLDVPPFGKVIDYLTYGGIYRAVSLDVKENVYLRDVFVTAGADGTFRIYPTLEGENVGCSLRAEIQDKAGHSSVFTGAASLPLSGSLNSVRTWSPDRPALYTLTLQLVRAGNGSIPDRVIDEKTLRFGFRTIEFTAGGLYLNGEKLTLRGLNRHQSWPYQGYAMPDSQQKLDARILKKELGCNAVRTSHYPQSHAFLDACDELGLLVFTEMPGWQSLGGEAWKAQAIQNCREMVLQYRNHPSIFLWGVRINESVDDDALYQKTNELVHRLDPTRPTGGVRCIKKSHCFEDVYTYNDFVHSGKNTGCEAKRAVTSDMKKGYLISEYNGHMYPTKPFDDEPHRLEHALRHARVLNDVAAQGLIAGSFGWCMFDYNTHRQFGSGDRICYHGVLDMFRNEKLAAAVYASQKPLRRAEDTVFELSSTLDAGDHPASFPGELWAFTNADSVRLYRDGEFINDFYPDRRGRFSALPHPPILINDFAGALLEKYEGFDHGTATQIAECLNAIRCYGPELPPLMKAQLTRLMILQHMNYEDGLRLYQKYAGGMDGSAQRYRLEAYHNGRVVRTLAREPVKSVRLEAVVRNPILTDGPTWDCAAVSLRAIDQNGNLLPYCGEAVVLSVEGPAKLLGPKIVPLRGGMAGTYLATVGEAGKATLHCAMEGALDVSVSVTIRKK